MIEKYFDETFLFVQDEEIIKEKEKKDIYEEYICKCFSYLLKQNDEYIIKTIENNYSLTYYFFSYIRNSNRIYDLNYIWNINNYYKKIDNCICDFYLKIIEIYLKDEKKLIILKSVFLQIGIMLDIIMMYYKLNKNKIKEALLNIYNANKFNFLNIDDYVNMLYNEINNINLEIDNFINCKNNNNLNNILFIINEFIFCIYCILKLFKNYYYYHIQKKELSDILIFIKLFSYFPENNDYLSNLSDKRSFLNLLIKLYFQLISIYIFSNDQNDKKNVLYLRYQFIKVLKNFMKQIIDYKCNISLDIINILKENSNNININFLINDIRLSNWNFLEKLVLNNKIEFGNILYINKFLKIKNKEEMDHLIKKKYEKEIKNIKDVANIKNENLILIVLEKNNFNISNCLFDILNMSDEEKNKLENKIIKENDEIKEKKILKNDIQNVKDMIKEKMFINFNYKQKNHEKQKYTYLSNREKNKNKEKIFNLLDNSSSSHEVSDYSIDNFQNEIIFPTHYTKNLEIKTDEEDENENEDKSESEETNKTNIQQNKIDYKKKDDINKNFINYNNKYNIEEKKNNVNNHQNNNNNYDNSKLKNFRIDQNLKYKTKEEKENKYNDKNINKRQYEKKRINKGKYYKNQYDKKMSKGML